MEANVAWFRTVKIEGLDCILYVGTYLVPIITLGEDALGQAFGTKACVRFPGNLEHDFVHHLNVGDCKFRIKSGTVKRAVPETFCYRATRCRETASP